MAELDVRTAALQSITMTRYVEGFTREMIEGFGEKNAREFLGQALDHLLETAAMLGNVSDRLASHTGEAEPTVFIDFKQATDLLAMFGGEPNEITLHVGEGHSGRGMYASYTDMPEEGTIFLGNSDQEAMPDTPPAATPAAPGEVTLNKKDLNKLLDDFARACAFGDDLLARMATSKAIHEYLDAAFAALSHPAPVRCKGKNCGTTTGDHSPECVAEHEAAYSSGGGLDTPGNREPESRYRGYKGQPLDSTASADQHAAWDEGNRAALAQAAPVAAPAPASEAVAYQGPKKFTAEEIADGCIGIRWVTAEGVKGRPSSHDVMEYLKRDKGALCSCKQCAAFFPMLATPSTGDSADAPVQQAVELSAFDKKTAQVNVRAILEPLGVYFSSPTIDAIVLAALKGEQPERKDGA